MNPRNSSQLNSVWPARRWLVAFVWVMCGVWMAVGGAFPIHAATPTGALTGAAQATNDQPTRLIIPSLGVDAKIEAVGQDEDGFMTSPTSVQTAAWYNLGPRPGETGNAVMAGHLDDVRGRPAVFWSLDELEAGDEIIVRFGDDGEKHFAVMSVETYAADEAPLERVFGVDFERDLNLITCDGAWDSQSKLYERRLVVYARLIRHSTSAASNTPVSNTTISNIPVDTTSVHTMQADTIEDATEANTTSTSPTPASFGATHPRQNRGQPLAAR